ncbi:MAG: hypothetical protein GC156_02485 [Actinomycetales bacterium]|nr:hypothetical protein [Actinomycetales bacterium]
MIRRLAITTAFAGGLALSGLAVAPAAHAAGSPVVVDCLGKGVTKPKQIVIACADAGILINRIRWTSWGADKATGVGRLAWNTCLPTDCASGVVQTYRVRITLGGLASGPGADVFSQASLRFPAGGPAGLETGSYTLDNELG